MPKAVTAETKMAMLLVSIHIFQNTSLLPSSIDNTEQDFTDDFRPFFPLDCTTLVKSGGAAISICGGEEDESCADVTNYARQIQQTCLSDGLVGGTYTISAATRVEVH